MTIHDKPKKLLEILSIKELEKRIEEKLKIQPTILGNWEFIEEKLSLYNRKMGYEVDIEEIKNIYNYNRWLFQISDKTPEEYDIGNYIKLFRKVFYYWFKYNPSILLYENAIVNWKERKIKEKK
jgi:hypothetical protein